MQISLRRQAPPNISPSENKPLIKGLWKVYAPGLIFGILRYTSTHMEHSQNIPRRVKWDPHSYNVSPIPTSGTNTIDSRREYFTGLLLIAFVEGTKTLNSLNSDTKFK